MDYSKEKSKYKSSDFRSRNFSGKWTSHFINEYVDSLFSENFEKVQERLHSFKNEHLPCSLFKFYPPTFYTLFNLQNNLIYLSSPKRFNDPFDSYVCAEPETYEKLYLLKYLKQKKYISDSEIDSNITQKEYWDIFYSRSKEDSKTGFTYSNHQSFYSTLYNICALKNDGLKKTITKLKIEARNEYLKKVSHIRNLNYKICCFSNFIDENEMLENTTMWSHYSENHSGICVKYKLDFDLINNKEAILCALFPVTYKSSVPKISPRELLKLKFNREKLDFNKPVLKTTLKTLTTKSKSWNYEKEWRLIFIEQFSEYTIDNLISFLPIESIYLGCKIDPIFKKSIITFFKNSDIEIYQTKQCDEKFKLYSIPQNLKILKDDEFYEKLRVLNKIKDEKTRINQVNKLFENNKKN